MNTLAPCRIDIEAIPLELRRDRQWLVWRYEHRGVDQQKPTKVPYAAQGGHFGSSTDPSTWSEFQDAVAALKRGYDGIGYALKQGTDVVSFDLDDCIGDDGEPDGWARKVIERIDSYTEISPSGRGVRIFLHGALPGSGHSRKLHQVDPQRYPRPKAAIEVYDRGRFLTVTGRWLNWTPRALKRRQDALLAIHAEHWPSPSDPPVPTRRPTAVATDLDDARLLEVAFAASNGAEIRALWEGDTSTRRGDASAADLALLSHLAFYTGQDAARMEHLFSQSALGQRAKWHERQDYRERSIAKAIASCTVTYSGHQEQLMGSQRVARRPAGDGSPVDPRGSTGIPDPSSATQANHAIGIHDATRGDAQGIPDEPCSDHCRHAQHEQKLARQLANLRQQISAQAELLRNPGLGPTAKLVTIAVVNDAGWRESTGAPAPYVVNCGQLAAAVGLGRQAIGRHLRALSGPNGPFEQRVTRRYNDEWVTASNPTGVRSVIELMPQGERSVVALLRATATYAPERPAWDGPRSPTCPDHPGAPVIERRAVICSACGQVLDGPRDLLKSQDTTSELLLGTLSPSVEDRTLVSLFATSDSKCWRCGRSRQVHGPADPIECLWELPP